jgi:hypothetical protein
METRKEETELQELEHNAGVWVPMLKLLTTNCVHGNPKSEMAEPQLVTTGTVQTDGVPMLD